VEADLVLRILRSQAQRDGFKSALGDHRNRSRNTYDRVGRQRGRDGNDASTRLLRKHLLDRPLRDVEEAFEVGGRERLEVFGLVVGEGFCEEDARIVDQRVDGSKPLDAGLDDLRCDSTLTDVAIYESQMIRFDEGTRPPDVARVCDNIISAIKERLDYAGSDALRSSRYNDRFLFACHISLLGCWLR